MALSAVPNQENQTGEAVDLFKQYGATGTPIMSGFLTDEGEFNGRFQSLISRMNIYETMRRTDAQVAAVLYACELPIRSARWDIVPGVDESKPGFALAKVLADFAKRNIFDGLESHSPDGDYDQQMWDDIIRHYMMAIGFGVSATEDLWTEINGKIQLEGFTLMLPRTYYRWILWPGTERLRAIEQRAWRGAEYVFAKVPAKKLTIVSFQQEGNNYEGLALMRSMYRPYEYKDRLYRIDAIGSEKNAMGYPTITMQPGAGDDDYKVAYNTVQKIAAGESTGVVIPSGATFTLQGLTGQTKDLAPSISHHNEMITQSGLCSFLALGQKTHGSAALSINATDFFSLAEQATADMLAQKITTKFLKRLIDYNYDGVSAELYPRCTVANVQARKFEQVIEALNKAGQFGFVSPDPGLEKFIRTELGAPQIQQPTDGVPKVTVPAMPESDKKEKPDGTKESDTAGQEPKQPKTPPVAQPGAKLSDAPVSKQFKRELLPIEKFVALSDIDQAMTTARDAVAAVLRSANAQTVKTLAQELGALVAKGSSADLAQVTPPQNKQLVRSLTVVLRKYFDFGGQQVKAELQRQRAVNFFKVDHAKLSDVNAAAIIFKLDDGTEDPIPLLARAIVSQYNNAITQRVTSIAAKRRTQDIREAQAARRTNKEYASPDASEVADQIAGDFDEMSDSWLNRVAQEGANDSIGQGRAEAANQLAEDIDHETYSAILDANTCGPCEEADGEEGDLGQTTPTPNPDCEGGSQCRCLTVYTLASEEKAAA